MRIPRLLAAGFMLRRLAKTLDRIDQHLREQNTLLTRLADQLAPLPPTAEDLSTQTSIDFLNAHEAGLVLGYMERTLRDVGRQPTEGEILSYLADEATIDLQARLAHEDARDR
jgi:hypothetical protein